MNPLKDPENIDEATQTINQYADSDWVAISYSLHGGERAAERIVPNDLVIMTLKQGRVVSFRKTVRNDKLFYSYEMEFVDRFGKVTVVTAIPGFQRLHIVTTYTDWD